MEPAFDATAASLRIAVQDLVNASVLPFADAAPRMLEVGRRAVGCTIAVLRVDSPTIVFPTGQLVDPPEALLETSEIDGDHVLIAPLRALSEDGVDASITLLGSAAEGLTSDQVLALDLVGAFATGLIRHEARRLADEGRTVGLLDRLDGHLSHAERTEDATRNGITVALGWLDALANDRIDQERRPDALSSATRRLAAVQSAVDAMIEETSHHLLGGLPISPTDVPTVWASVTGLPVDIHGSPDSVAFSNERALAEFIAVAAPVLDPEIRSDSDWIRVGILDATRLTRRARVLLRASSGTLLQDARGTSAAWCRAISPE